MDMFCYQCEQTDKGVGCEKKGVCGKEPEVSALQDIILHQVKGISFLAHHARIWGETSSAVNHFTLEALFTTVTNVNFDPESLTHYIKQGEKIRDEALELYERGREKTGANSDGIIFPQSVRFQARTGADELVGQALELMITQDHPDQDVRSLAHLLIYGIKGMAAYAHHAFVLGYEHEEIYSFIHEAFAELSRSDIGIDRLLELNMQCGNVNLRSIELLDLAHTSTFGHPEPTSVSMGLRKGPAIIISGHDLKDLLDLLVQTEGKGINVYTHGEMLPAHGYPGLKKYKHLAGHFGTAWQNQQKEFHDIAAAIYFTTNCIQEPKESYQDRVFTGNAVAWPGARHIKNGDFAPLIQKALSLGGFQEKPGKSIMTGFGRQAVLGVADRVVAAVKSGAIRRFFLIGGCDGAKPGRNYYTKFALAVPKDCMILTLACGKFRFNQLDFGEIGGIPRLLDIGQCNDAYSAVKIAEALAGAFKCGVNDLPLTFIVSWYEQKAVAVLLSLLSLGIKGIRLGPSLPAFLSPNVLDILVKKFEIKPNSNPEKDLEASLEPAKVA